MRGWKRRVGVCFLAALGVVAAAKPGRAEKPSELTEQGYVNDFGNFIDDQSGAEIGDICRNLDEKTGDRLLIVTVKSTEGLTPGQFAGQLRSLWVGVAEVRERTLVFVVNGQGRIGGDIGDSFDVVLPHSKLDSILKSSFALGGNNYGRKLSDFARQVAEAIEAGVATPGSATATPAASRSPGGDTRQTSAPGSSDFWLSPSARRAVIGVMILLILIGAYDLSQGKGFRRPLPMLLFCIFVLCINDLNRLFRRVGNLAPDAQGRLAIAMAVAVGVAILLLAYGFLRVIFNRGDPNWSVRRGRVRRF